MEYFYYIIFVCAFTVIIAASIIKYRQIHLENGYTLKQIPGTATQTLEWVKDP